MTNNDLFSCSSDYNVGIQEVDEQHEELMKQVQDLQHKLDNEGATITFELLHFLKVWLTQHINESDKRFGTFLKTAGLNQYTTWSKEVETTMKKKKWWWKFW